jgi:hypothetical protein
MKFSSLLNSSRVVTILSLAVLGFALITSISIASHHRNMAAASSQARSSSQSESGVRATLVNYTYETASPETIIWADGHSDQCLANYNQCMKGCDGATSCSKQCKVNYDNCMKQ